MVLAELGSQITAAFRKLHTVTVIDDQAVDECIREIASALLHADVNVRQVAELRSAVKKVLQVEMETPGTNKRRLIQMTVVEQLVEMLTPTKKPYVSKKGKANIIMFVGLQGSGKTTSCTKYAYHYQRKGWKTALICADTFRAGAFDQLKQNATKVKIPFYGSYMETDPVRVAEEGVAQLVADGYELIIIDTSGRHRQESALFEEMKQVAEITKPNNIVFVMDSHIGQACYDQAKAFRSAVDVGSVVVTKLDGHAKGGGALAAVSATDSPIIFLGTGEHFDDFEPFEPKSFVSRLLGMGDLSGLFNTINEVVPLERQPQLIQRLSQGRFTLRDMYEQLQSVLKLGPIGKVMSMIPGIGSHLIPKGQEQAGIQRVRRFLCVMDSMNDDELDCVKPMVDSRILRVARGSGSSLLEVKELLDQHKQFQKMIGKMGKLGLTKKGTDVQQMMRNPNQMMSKMQQMMDPKMLQQLGGAQNLMQMMKEMGKNEGGFQSMMKDLAKG